MKKIFASLLALALIFQSKVLFSSDFDIISKEEREARRQEGIDQLQRQFDWWPTDATPGPVKDEKREGYWWWPTTPGNIRPWGNRGHVYVYKIIFDYKEGQLPPPRPQEPRPSLLVRKTIRNTKVYFDYNKAELRNDHITILDDAIKALKKNPETDILITGNCDRRGSEAYNLELGKRRANAVKQYMLEKGIPDERIRIVSRGKLDALAPLTDLVGMQKDRNAHFVVAEVEEVMIPYSEEAKKGASPIEKEERIESGVIVSTRQYVIKTNDTLKKIAEKELGASHRWEFLYEFNKERIEDPEALEAGTVILIPVEQQAQVASMRLYTVKKNDSLWKIAKRQLGDGSRWKQIYELNKGKIKNPDKLLPGTEIAIPEE